MDEILEKIERIKGRHFIHVPLDEVSNCYEKSDIMRLCANPTVSIVMMAYNHEEFLQQAIDGVISQVADFEFELIICEDCSTDKTREICFKNQARYPEIIRVLWSDNNSKGANLLRGEYFARGEFIAYCEGDDYWTYPRKLAEQVELMRRNPSAGIGYAGTNYMLNSTKKIVIPYNSRYMPKRVLKGEEMCRRVILGFALRLGFYGPGRHFSTCILRKRILEEQKAKYPEIFNNCWLFRDTIIFAMVALRSDVCFLDKCTSVYRINDGGITRRLPTELMINVDLFNIYFSTRFFDLSFEESCDLFSDKLVWTLYRGASNKSGKTRDDLISHITREPLVKALFLRWHCRGLLNALITRQFKGLNSSASRIIFKMGASLRKKLNRKKYYERHFR